MQLVDIISPERVVSNVQAKSKKRALETISEVIASNADIDMGANDIFDSLIARERLGTTAIGHGIAIPHGRVKESTETIGAFVQLSDGVDCDALDNESVKLLFAVLVPEKTNEDAGFRPYATDKIPNTVCGATISPSGFCHRMCH